MSASTSGLRVEPMRVWGRSEAQLAALFGDGWPAFIDADLLAAQHLPVVRDTFGGLEVALLQDDVLVGAGWGVPITWSGASDQLPSGYSESLARAVSDHQSGVTPDTLVVCAAQVHPERAGVGLAAAVLDGLIDAGAAVGLTRVVAPLRPMWKHRYPLTPIVDYAGWTRGDGSAFDPWLRTHLRMGARLIGTNPTSQTFTGTVKQWEEWSGLEIPAAGAYIVPRALAPLIVDHTADLGTCVEPTVWVQHR